MADLSSPPATLADAKGAPHEGAYAGTIPCAELDGDLFRRLRKKSWRFVGVFRDDLVVAAAIADVGYLGLSWAYVAEGGRPVERGWKSPAAVGISVGAFDGASAAVAPGRLVSLATTRTGGVTLAVDLPGIRANLDIVGSGTPLTVVSGDVGRGSGRPGLTVKNVGLLAMGTVTVEGRSYTLDDARASLDWTQAFFPRHTAWFWATGAGTAVDGRTVGFNIAKGVHDDVHGRYNENALWIDGTPSALPPVTFTIAKGTTPWSIHSDDGSVDLVFEPRGERSEDVNLVVLRSRYRQPFGSFTGRLRDAKGREVRIEGVPGVTEDHEAVW